MMQFRDESNRRAITEKIYGATGETYEEPGPITLHYANFCSLSRDARDFLELSTEEKVEAIEKEFPPEHITEEEAEELRTQLKARINGIGGRIRVDGSAD